MARTTITERTRWDTLHKNGPFPLKWFISTKHERKGDLPDPFDRYNDATSEIKKLIKDARDANQGFRAVGSKWSMSSIAHHQDRMHFNSLLNIKIPVHSGDLHTSTNYNAKNLFFLECGNQIKEISKFLEDRGKSLKTTGASNGQTIAGCISTGVHGSAIDVGSVQDYVVGINLITGFGPNDNIYIERNSDPALNDNFVSNFNARVIRNDDLFNAALVSLGSFGFIHGVVIEAEDRFLLKRYVKKINKETALKLATTLNFKNSAFKIPGETDANGDGLRPYHYKVFINPYNDQDEYAVEAIYKKPYDPDYKTKFGDPVPFMKEFVYRDLIYLLIKISESFPKAIPKFIQALNAAILPKEDKVVVGKLSEIFWDAGYQGRAFALSFGVDHKDSEKALKVLTDLARDEGPIPGIYAMRFIKQSDATLAFSKFPFTCMIEIDGIQWEGTNKIISLEKFAQRMIEVLKAAQIPFTIHWGKNANWSFPGLVDHMFGAEAAKWKNIRNALLSEEMAELFSNDFLKAIKLAEFVPPAADDGLIDPIT
jgi:hypothetical protein